MSTAQLIHFPTRRVANPDVVAEVMCDAQAALRRLRRELAPVAPAVTATRDWHLMSDQEALADLLALAQRVARRMAGRAEVLAGKACPCGQTGPGHGRAASA
jgi:hypothetical protein